MIRFHYVDANPTHFRLAVPIAEASEFAFGMSDWCYDNPPDELRCLVGQLLIDQLEYSENWRAAALVRRTLQRKYPQCFSGEA